MNIHNKLSTLIESVITPETKLFGNTLKQGLSIFLEYYNPILPPDTKRNSVRYKGRGVIWYGSPDQMIVVHKDYIEGMWGNIYSSDKINSLVNMIENSDDPIELECSYGTASIITFNDIIEEQTSFANDTFNSDYDGKHEPVSIGDSDLDAYIGSEYLDDIPQGDLSLFTKYKFNIAQGADPKSILTELQAEHGDDFDTYNMIDDFKEFITTELDLQSAIKNSDGDLGDIRIQLRDAHHRIMAAIKSGEEYVCLNLDKDDLPLINGHQNVVNRVTMRPSEAEINTKLPDDDDDDDEY